MRIILAVFLSTNKFDAIVLNSIEVDNVKTVNISNTNNFVNNLLKAKNSKNCLSLKSRIL